MSTIGRGRHLQTEIGIKLLGDDDDNHREFHMSDPSLYSSKSRIIPKQTASDGNSAIPKVTFSKASSQNPRTNRAVYSSSKVVARTKNSCCPPGRKLSESARVTNDRRSSKGASGKKIDDDSRRYQSGQLSTESGSFLEAESWRGSGTWSGRRGTNATVLNGGIESSRRPGCKDDNESPIRSDSNEPSLELDQRQSIDDFDDQGRGENRLDDDDTARESIDEVRRRVQSLLKQEGREFSTKESEYLENESLEGSDSKLTLGLSEVLTGHSGQVLSLVRHDGIIFSAAADGSAKVRDFLKCYIPEELLVCSSRRSGWTVHISSNTRSGAPPGRCASIEAFTRNR